MTGYIIRRLLATIPVLLVVGVFTFVLLHVIPGDPAAVIAGEYATPDDVARIRAKLGLDEPIYTQMGLWLGRLLRGDLGVSIFSQYTVVSLIGSRLEPTLSLTIMVEIFALSLAIPMGVLAAWKANTWIDRAVMVFSVLGFSLPVFWLGFMLMWALAIKLPLLPVAGYRSFGDGFGPYIEHLVLPALTLGLVYMALIARMTRASMLEVLREDYVRTARAKGLREQVVLVRHALRNAALPILTIIGLGFALLIGGAVVTESVFAVPGLGRLTVDAILRRDYPIIQGMILVVSAAYVFINLAVDLAYAYFDPRIKY